MSLALTSRRAALMPGQWVRNELWRRAKAVPSLDLRFADNKSLVNATTGASLVTFTRASSATYVDSQGVIQTAVTNLLLRSEEFDNVNWTKQSSVSVSVNTTTAPNGSLTADTITGDSDLGVYQNITSTVGLTYANSIYVKAGTATSMLFRDDTGAGRHIQFNPSTGVITATSGTLLSSASTAVGDGWFRYSMVYVADATTARGVLRPSSSGSAQTFILWGAQLEQSSTVGEYIPTTSTVNSAPRFDHNPTMGESLGLLVEEQRTNLITNSEALANVTGASTTSNTTTAPDGALTADTLTEDTSTGNHSVNTASIAWAGNTIYTFTIFLKANTRNQVNLAFGTSSNWVNGQRSAVFDLSTGTVASVAGSPVVASIDAFPGGWYRCRLTATTVAAPAPSATQTQIYVSGSTSYTGNGTSGLYFWGAQLEVGAFPTSYIPTTSATVTRSADVASISGSNFSGWYNATEGSNLIEFREPDRTSTRTPRSFSDGTATNRWDAFISSTATLNTRVVIAGAQNNPGALTVSTGATLNKHVLAVGAPNAISAINSTLSTASTSSAVPTVDRLIIGADSVGGSPLTGHIRRLTYWPTRLPNSILQTITQ